MSTNLVWRIKEYRRLPHPLKLVLEKKWSFPITLGLRDIYYLEGLKDAGIEGASELIGLIDEFIEIELDME